MTTQIHDVMMPIRLPSDLKGLFDGLCKSRGVSVSSEVRRLMAEEVLTSTLSQVDGIEFMPKPKPIKTIRKPRTKTPSTPATADKTVTPRCDKTPDFFDNATNAQKRLQTVQNAKQAPIPSDDLKTPQTANKGQPDPLSSVVNARKKRKKSKKKTRGY